MATITKIGKYEVIEVLGRGGMGVVYKAMDARIGRLVAIKMITSILSENADLLQRFYREAQSTGMLQHPNIVIVYDLGDQEGIPYLVMEYLEGEALDKMIGSHAQFPLVEKLGIIIQVCNALGYAHRRGIIHRDIKPANVMVLKDATAKIVDFGVARIGGDTLTRTGQVLGTINYMSPEQVNAQPMDGRTDIFSAGVMLYQLLTNALPFEGNDTAATLLKILHEDPPPLSGFLRDVPPGLEIAIQKALAKNRDDRYSSAEDLAFDLTRVQEDLKRQMVAQHISQAQASVARSEYAKAKKILLEVLKVDTQHGVARQLLQEAQELLHKEQRREQVRQLQSLAQEAVDRDMPGEAIGYLDQAISLDKTDTALLNLRETLHQAKDRKDRCDALVRRAESAQMSGDLEEAEKAAAEALGVDAHDTQARMLHSAITKQLAERERQQKMHVLLEEAHKQISGRHFTSAFDILKKAETIDPNAPEVHALINLATAGREQEVRRQELEKFTSQVEEALHRDEFQTAFDRAEEALQSFPGDRGLAKLKALAEKQRNIGENAVSSIRRSPAPASCWMMAKRPRRWRCWKKRRSAFPGRSGCSPCSPSCVRARNANHRSAKKMSSSRPPKTPCAISNTKMQSKYWSRPSPRPKTPVRSPICCSLRGMKWPAPPAAISWTRPAPRPSAL